MHLQHLINGRVGVLVVNIIWLNDSMSQTLWCNHRDLSLSGNKFKCCRPNTTDMIKQNNNESRVQPAVCFCMTKTEASDITFNSWATFGFIDPYLKFCFFSAPSWGSACRLMNCTHQEDSGVSPIDTLEMRVCLPTGKLKPPTTLQTLNAETQKQCEFQRKALCLSCFSTILY